MNNLSKFLVGCLLFLLACGQQRSNSTEVAPLADGAASEDQRAYEDRAAPESNFPKDLIPFSQEGHEATCSFLTEDPNGIPVLCWSESVTGKDSFELKYARFDPQTQQFGQTISVPPSRGMQAHCESAAKVGFFPDGSVMAVFRFAAPTEDNRFAGGLWTSQSTDGGATWTEKQPLVEASESPSQSYFDLVNLQDGALGMVWLDGRKLSADQNGSCLAFARTAKGLRLPGAKAGLPKDAPQPKTWQSPQILKTGVCQCCRTDLYRDLKDQVHLVYRDILQDSIRDMVHLVSQDEGRSFSPPTLVYPDGWAINGCPHSGPTLAESSDGLACAWFSQGGGQGIWFTQLPSPKAAKKELVSQDGTHPQMVALPDGRYLVALELVRNLEQGAIQEIVLFSKQGQAPFAPMETLAPGRNGKFPVLKVLESGNLLISWTLELEGQDQIVAKVVDLDRLLGL